MEKVIDCMGMGCPLPVVNAKKAVEEFTEDGRLTVQVDNETAMKNLTKFAASRNFEVSSTKKGENAYEVTMLVKKATCEEAEKEKAGGRQGGVTVVLAANTMGTGEEKLGKALMKAFIFALTSQDELPEYIVCYNTGAYLTTEGSDSLADLKNLEAAGVKIMTCGTCLDYYQIKDKLAVGTVSNMYEIVETQMRSALIIRP